jgi:hypothetical protein
MSEVQLFEEKLFEFLQTDYTGSSFTKTIAAYNPETDVITLGFKGADEFPDLFLEEHIEEILVHETIHQVIHGMAMDEGSNQWFDRVFPTFEGVEELVEIDEPLRLELNRGRVALFREVRKMVVI